MRAGHHGSGEFVFRVYSLAAASGACAINDGAITAGAFGPFLCLPIPVFTDGPSVIPQLRGRADIRRAGHYRD